MISVENFTRRYNDRVAVHDDQSFNHHKES